MRALYMDDCYLREFSSAVMEIIKNDDGTGVVLENTAFYPAGGGVPCDLGFIEKAGLRFEVTGVKKIDGKIVHIINGEMEKGDFVHGVIDWQRRYALMRHHTAAHLLAAVLYMRLGAMITGNQLDVGRSRMDFSLDNFDKEIMGKAVNAANAEIAKNLPVKIYYLPWEEAMKIGGVFKLAKEWPHHLEILRIVEIAGVDVQADGGCHVRSLAEIGCISIEKMENKGKSNRRIYYSLAGSGAI